MIGITTNIISSAVSCSLKGLFYNFALILLAASSTGLYALEISDLESELDSAKFDVDAHFSDSLQSHKALSYHADLHDIKTREVIRIGMLSSREDFNISDGHIFGLATLIGNAYAKSHRLRVEYYLRDSMFLLHEGLKKGAFDLILSSSCDKAPKVLRIYFRKHRVCYSTHTQNIALKKDVTRWMHSSKRSGLLAVLGFNQHDKVKSSNDRISPYDDVFKRVAEATNIDWRLLAAMSFHESGFNPKVRSKDGALGIMQMMPKTAKSLGVRDPLDPYQAALGAAQYLKNLMGKFNSKSIRHRDQVRLALAAYNVGLAHVFDARVLARELNLNPERWFGNVERAIEYLDDPQYYKNAKHGRCRSKEVIKHLSKVMSRYDAFVLADTQLKTL